VSRPKFQPDNCRIKVRSITDSHNLIRKHLENICTMPVSNYLVYLVRAVAQAVSRRLPTAEVRVRGQVKSIGICGAQSGTGAGFLRILRFPLQILIPPTTPHSSSSITRGWYNRPNSGRRTKWTQSHPTPIN
jgi:hypothetical protein